MVLSPFNKDYSSPEDQAWKKGWSPYNETLGPNRASDADPKAFTNRFVSSLRSKNPDYRDFYNQNVFSADEAKQSQSNIDRAYNSFNAQFKNKDDNYIANDFLAKYSSGVDRGLIEPDRAVFPDSLARLVTQPATAGSSVKDPNTVGKFAGSSGAQIS